MEEDGVLLRAPMGVGMYFPSIVLTLGSKPVTREMIEKSYAAYGSESSGKMLPLEAMRIGPASGWAYSRIYTDKTARTLPRPTVGDYPLDVEHIETHIALDFSGVAYHIRFACPRALNEKFKPDFDRFLGTLKFDAKTP